MGASLGMGDHDFGDRRRRAVAAIVGRHDLVFDFRRRHVIDGWSPLNPRNEKGHVSQFSKQPCSQGLIILVMVPCDRRKRQRTGPSAAATGSRVAVQRRAAQRPAGRWFWIWRAARKKSNHVVARSAGHWYYRCVVVSNWIHVWSPVLQEPDDNSPRLQRASALGEGRE